MKKTTSYYSCLLIAGAAFLTQTNESYCAPRPNTFMLQSAQAGSTTDIDNIKVTNLDTGAVVYTNSFDKPQDATRGLRLAYWPQGGTNTRNFTVSGPMTKVVNGKLRLETTGFNRNGSGGYESHSEAEFTGNLPKNFLVEFDATRLQWPGHFHFCSFYRNPSDSPFAFEPGGAFSLTRKANIPADTFRMAASGSWFQELGVLTNFGKPTETWVRKFPAPAGSLMQTHRLGLSLSNNTLSYYLDGQLLKQTDVSDIITPVEMFTHGFKHINQAGAESYLIASANVRKYSEWQNPPVTYWGPTTNDKNSSLTYKFTRPGQITGGSVVANLASFNFPWPGYAGAGKGSSSLWASRDGKSWTLLLDNPTPSDRVDSYKKFNAELPASVLGGRDLWIQVRMRTTQSPLSSYTTAQFSRSSTASIENIFEVNLKNENKINK
jgi:hypothetical protein